MALTTELYVPAGHLVHVGGELASGLLLYVPATHPGMQVAEEVAPEVELNVPVGHAVQVAEDVAAVAVLYVSGPHTVQFVGELPPGVLLNVPAGHAIFWEIPIQ